MARDGELAAILCEARERAARIREISELWGDYRYTVLAMVFGRLVGERRLSIDDLNGLEPEKLAAIRLWTKD